MHCTDIRLPYLFWNSWFLFTAYFAAFQAFKKLDVAFHFECIMRSWYVSILSWVDFSRPILFLSRSFFISLCNYFSRAASKQNNVRILMTSLAFKCNLHANCNYLHLFWSQHEEKRLEYSVNVQASHVDFSSMFVLYACVWFYFCIKQNLFLNLLSGIHRVN